MKEKRKLIAVTLLFLAILTFSQNKEQYNAYLKEITDRYNANLEEMNKKYKAYIESNWAAFQKIQGVSLPSSPDLLKTKTLEMPETKKDEHPSIAIKNSLIKENVDAALAENIALDIIDDIGLDSIKSGQYLSISTEKDKEKRPPVVIYQINSQENLTLLKSNTNNYKFFENNKKPTAKQNCSKVNSNYVFPLKNSCKITSRFGMKEINRKKPHEGTDYKEIIGAEILAIANGTVVKNTFEKDGAGYYVVVKHEDGIESHYMHLKEKGIAQGTKVIAGQAIGKVGNTGNSRGSHLHLGIKKNGIWQDPEKILTM